MAFLLWEDGLTLIKEKKAKTIGIFVSILFIFFFKENSLQKMIKFGTRLLQITLTLTFGEEQVGGHLAAPEAFLSQA